MQRYFEDMLPAEELEQLKFIPTIPQFVTWIEEKWQDLPALSDTVNTYTYNQVCKAVAQKRALLNSLGLQKGDKVAILDNSTPEAVEMFLAVTSAGYVAINLPAQLPEPAVVGCCMKFGVKVLAYGEPFAPIAEKAPCSKVKVGDVAETTAPVAEVNADDPAAIFFTGGTTGAPKGALLPHRSIMRGSLNGCFAPGKQLACHTYANVLPLSHVFGLVKGTMSALYTGALWVSGANVKETLGKFPAIRPTMLVAVPGICEILMGLVDVRVCTYVVHVVFLSFYNSGMHVLVQSAALLEPLLDAISCRHDKTFQVNLIASCCSHDTYDRRQYISYHL